MFLDNSCANYNSSYRNNACNQRGVKIICQTKLILDKDNDKTKVVRQFPRLIINKQFHKGDLLPGVNQEYARSMVFILHKNCDRTVDL